MKNHIPDIHLPKALIFAFLLGVMLPALCAGNVPSAFAQSASQARVITMVPGTVAVGVQMRTAIGAALQDAADIPVEAIYFAVTDLQLQANWALASVAGLARVHDGQTWNLDDDAAWTGLVLLRKSANGKWAGSTQGTTSFSALIDQAPDTFVDGRAKTELDPLRRASMQTLDTAPVYAFPWKAGTTMMYGTLGVHSNDFTSIVPGWKAVDMLSDGDTTQGHSPNQLLASAPGTISYRCKDSNNIAIHLGDFFYTHLASNAANVASLTVGASFEQGAVLGPMKKGSFTGPCGHADQPSTWFHVHWGFPNAPLHVEKWTLSMSTGSWTNGSMTVTPGKGWIMAGSTDPCLAPVPSSPAAGGVVTSQSVDFNWAAVSACIFTGYQLRVKTDSNMDSGGGTILDASTSLPKFSALIPSDWNSIPLYWGVKAANAPFGSGWAVQQFSIQPAPGTVPGDYGHCADEGQRCAFSGAALVYYGAGTSFVGPLSFTDCVDCGTASFPGSVADSSNQCFIKGGRPEGSTLCSADGGTCKFPDYVATVYYGVNGGYNKRTGAANSIACNSGVFGDPFPGLAKSCYSVITGSAIVSKTFESVASRDGFIVESAEASNKGGTVNSTAGTFKLGDDAANRQFRAILSFNTGILPDNVLVMAATIRFKQAGALVGSDPFATLGNILLDVRKGAYSGDLTLQNKDFQAACSVACNKNGVLSLGNSPLDGWYSGSFAAPDLVYINRRGVTQFRLRFALDDNDNRLADFIKFYTSDYSNYNFHPTLTVTYHLP